MFILDRAPVAHSIARSLPTARGPGFDPLRRLPPPPRPPGPSTARPSPALTGSNISSPWFPGFLSLTWSKAVCAFIVPVDEYNRCFAKVRRAPTLQACAMQPAPRPPSPCPIACRLWGRSSGWFVVELEHFSSVLENAGKLDSIHRDASMPPGKIMKRPDTGSDARGTYRLGVGRAGS